MSKQFSWDHFADAGTWSDLTDCDQEEWRFQIGQTTSVDGPNPQRDQVLLPLRLWRALDFFARGARLLYSACKARGSQ